MRLRIPSLLGLALGLVTLGIASGDPQDLPNKPAMAPEELFDTCAGCHENEAASFANGPHSALGFEIGCAACHGEPTGHLDSGGEAGNIFAFSDTDFANVKSAQCLTCHGDSHPGFFASRHAASGLDCASCHSMHSNDGVSRSLLKPSSDGGLIAHGVGAASATCAECHAGTFAEFEFNERHRLREGTLDCSTCHDPHASQARWRLGGFKQDQCGTCHADKTGPFVFEHGGQRVEGCAACHQPHGSPNRHMLTFQSVAELCYTCHATVPGFHTRFNADSHCTNCHSAIHGSNFDAAIMK